MTLNTRKMRLLYVLLFVVLTEAKKRRLGRGRKVAGNDMLVDIPDIINLDSSRYKLPVPFGHIYRDGFEDPNSEAKQPVDALELRMVVPKSPEDLMSVIERRGKNHVQIIEKPGFQVFASPRDKYLDSIQNNSDTSGMLPKNEEKNVSEPGLFHLASIQQRNVAYPRPKLTRNDKIQYKVPPDASSNGSVDKDKSEFFSKSSFNLTPDKREEIVNWTTCDEFGRRPNFDPKDIVDIFWVPFYIWSVESNVIVAHVHRFTYPTKKLVKQYKDDFGPYINQSIDWEQPKIVMKEMREMLLIAADRKGLFYAIPHHEIPSVAKSKHIRIPTISIRFKIVKPYLAMMFCEDRFATIMAISGNEPDTLQKINSEAARLKFKGYGYPVFRDIEGEQIKANAEREQSLKMDNKYINVEENYDVRQRFWQ